MEAPQQIVPHGLDDYLGVMSKAVFQTGISWAVVENKWPGIREAMRGFDPRALAAFSEADLDRLATDPRVIRNRRKLAAIVDNARTMLELDERHGGFQRYLRSHPDFAALVADLRRNFAFMGEMGCYYFLYVVGEDVPPYEQWHAAREVTRKPARAR